MRTRISSIFYKLLVLFIIVGLLPAGLVSSRLLILNRDLMAEVSATWFLPDNVGQELNLTMTGEAGKILIYTLVATILGAIFLSGYALSPVRRLQAFLLKYEQGEFDEGLDIHSRDEIGDLAKTIKTLARDHMQLKNRLDVVTAQRNRDQEQRAFQLQIGAQLTQDSASPGEINSLLQRTAQLIQNRYSYYYVGIYLIDDNREYAVLSAATGEAGQVLLKRNYRLKVGDVGIVTYVANTGDLRVVNNVDIDFVYRQDSLLPLTRSEAALPLRVKNQVIGILDVHSPQVGAFAEDDLISLQIMSDQIAVVVQNARLVEELDNRSKEINLLYKRYTREGWEQEVGGWQPRGYQYDMSDVSPLDRRVPLPQISDRGVQAITPEGGLDGKTKSALVAPLKLYDQIIGMLGVESDQLEHTWTSEEIALMEAVSNQVVLALDNARLLEETQKRAEQLRLLQEITSAAASQKEVSELLGDIAERIYSGYALQRCAIVLFDPAGIFGTVMCNVANEDVGNETVGQRIYIKKDDAASVVLQTKEFHMFNDLKNNVHQENIQEYVKHTGARSMAVVPVLLRGEVIGIIILESNDPYWKPDQDEIQLLKQISLQTANAIDIARSFESASQRADRERIMGGITSRMRETLNVEMVLQTAVNEIFRAANLEKVSCYLVPVQPSDSIPQAAGLTESLPSDHKES